MSIFVIDTAVLPTLVVVIIWGALEVPVGWLPKFRLVGEKLMAVATPVRATVRGLAGEFAVTVKLPFCVPGAVGRNVTLIVQEAPGANEVPQLLVWLYGAVTAILLIVRAVVPVLVSVAVFDGLRVLMTCVANVIVDGASVAELVVPVPERATVCGLLGAESVMVNEPLSTPVVAGLKVTEIEQEAPAASEEPQVLLSVKSLALVPVMAIPVIMSAVLLLFVRVASRGEVVTPTAELPKLSAQGQTCSPRTNLATKTMSFPWELQLLHTERKAPGVVGKSGEKVRPVR